MADTRLFVAIFDAASAGYVPLTDTPVHGDLYARHLLISDDRQLACVIDQGDVHRGDPAVASDTLPLGVWSGSVLDFIPGSLLGNFRYLNL
jgi:hypothetical protein